MGQQHHCHIQCYTYGVVVSVMSSGKPHQSQDLQTWSCGLVAWPQPCALCLGLCTTALVARYGTCSGYNCLCGYNCLQMSGDTPLTAFCRDPVPPVKTMN